MAIPKEVIDFYKNYCACHYCEHYCEYEVEFGTYGICALPDCEFEPKKTEDSNDVSTD